MDLFKAAACFASALKACFGNPFCISCSSVVPFVIHGTFRNSKVQWGFWNDGTVTHIGTGCDHPKMFTITGNVFHEITIQDEVQLFLFPIHCVFDAQTGRFTCQLCDSPFNPACDCREWIIDQKGIPRFREEMSQSLAHWPYELISLLEQYTDAEWWKKLLSIENGKVKLWGIQRKISSYVISCRDQVRKEERTTRTLRIDARGEVTECIRIISLTSSAFTVGWKTLGMVQDMV